MNKVNKCTKCRANKRKNQPCLGCLTLNLMRKQQEDKSKVEN